ncbi:hypothetical protein VIN01S_22730 [Vibrio inusitatus NBRC 102082]|uniref:DUF3299 domain-containing protein n=1 Tax=Vibrio inusitatus NBRC 102082 TaxID=1219070 RepID=A0A4Y3HWB6_9VIBR|nr:DUF3299 domain-containing protein [Vibrio inusitatus]GEA51469.1 hypothetical protein VIN01S_22730 [Vibrio inusitatus NBRC 102082]
MKFLPLVTLILSFATHADLLELNWLDLVPEHEQEQVRESVRKQMQMSPHDESTQVTFEQAFLGSVREELNNTQVRIPGFVIPIEGTSMSVKEFLLVPFYGACIHIPPPPQNQLIHVTMNDFEEIKGMWEVVYVTGNLTTQSYEHELASVGYRLSGTSLSR